MFSFFSGLLFKNGIKLILFKDNVLYDGKHIEESAG